MKQRKNAATSKNIKRRQQRWHLFNQQIPKKIILIFSVQCRAGIESATGKKTDIP